jgi:hypothetical protein
MKFSTETTRRTGQPVYFGVRRAPRILRAALITFFVVLFIVRYAIRQYVRKELGDPT